MREMTVNKGFQEYKEKDDILEKARQTSSKQAEYSLLPVTICKSKNLQLKFPWIYICHFYEKLENILMLGRKRVVCY